MKTLKHSASVWIPKRELRKLQRTISDLKKSLHAHKEALRFVVGVLDALMESRHDSWTVAEVARLQEIRGMLERSNPSTPPNAANPAPKAPPKGDS